MLTDSSGSLRYSADLSIDPSAKTVSVQPNPADGLSLETVGYLGQPRGWCTVEYVQDLAIERIAVPVAQRVEERSLADRGTNLTDVAPGAGQLLRPVAFGLRHQCL